MDEPTRAFRMRLITSGAVLENEESRRALVKYLRRRVAPYLPRDFQTVRFERLPQTMRQVTQRHSGWVAVEVYETGTIAGQISVLGYTSDVIATEAAARRAAEQS